MAKLRPLALLAAIIWGNIAMATDLSKAFRYETFSVPAGTKLKTLPGFGACDNGVVTQSSTAETSIARGDKGWGRWGYEYKPVPRLVAGDELWWSVDMYFPADFSFATDHGSLKTFRWHRTRQSDGKSKGYIDVQIRTNGTWRVISEMADSSWNGWVNWTDPAGQVIKGEWARWEVYVKFGDRNQGIIRAYKNGKMFGEIRGKETLQPGYSLARLLHFTYWNGTAPKTQSMRFDNFTLFVQGQGHNGRQHLARDAHGNPFIGMGNEEPVEPPIEPPTEPLDKTVTLRHDGTEVRIEPGVCVVVQSDLPVVSGVDDGDGNGAVDRSATSEDDGVS